MLASFLGSAYTILYAISEAGGDLEGPMFAALDALSIPISYLIELVAGDRNIQ